MQDRLQDQDDELDNDEVDERLDDAASFISVMDELRPLEPDGFNLFPEVWARIARIPPQHRHRLLGELEPGSLRSLWKASMGRYVLDEAACAELLGRVSLWEDFPQQPGQVVEYEGLCERTVIGRLSGTKLEVDDELQERMPRATPWLRPTPSSVEVPVSRFRQVFFVPRRSDTLERLLQQQVAEVADPEQQQLLQQLIRQQQGPQQQPDGLPLVYGRVLLPLFGGLDRWWDAIYCRMQMELVLTPLQADAGADITLLYPSDLTCQAPGGWGLLTSEQLPSRAWPEPAADGWSPLSGTGRDYLRVAGPGVYVGCAYRPGPGKDELREENCVYFVLARRTYGRGRG